MEASAGEQLSCPSAEEAPRPVKTLSFALSVSSWGDVLAAVAPHAFDNETLGGHLVYESITEIAWELTGELDDPPRYFYEPPSV